MIERNGNIWNTEIEYKCITTNGCISSCGLNIMGKGIALQAKKKYPKIARILGDKIKKDGNHVYYLENQMFSFPTKHHWRRKSDICLIIQSANELVKLIDELNINMVSLPRPGCGNGGLRWIDVKKELEKVFDDRFIIINEETEYNII